MDDELEDKVFYQTYISHMKILSKFAVGLSSINSPLAYIWKVCRLYVLRPEVLFAGIIFFILLVYLQAVDVWSRGLLGRLQATLGRHKANRAKLVDPTGNSDYQCWTQKEHQSAAFALLGRRPRMEDRFIIEENINNNTGISFFAIFDGHGGEFAADFAKDILVQNIYNKVIETTKLLTNQKQNAVDSKIGNLDATQYDDFDASPYLRRKASRKGDKENDTPTVQRRESAKKGQSVTDDCTPQGKDDDIFTTKLNSLIRNSYASGAGSKAKDALFNNNNKDGGAESKPIPPKNFDAKCYLENGKINFGKLITDEVLAADFKLVEAAKRTTNIAGTTALIAIIDGSKLFVANVGDSRGVMCNARGIAIPLSFDHKPQQVRERKRIHDAGGFIAFRGVWRVAGILATSRALGDYPLKDKNLVIANPDILTFDLSYHKPTFMILASDGLWDTFSNEEACTFIKEHLSEPDYGAKSLAMQSYQRGSVDNITVLIIAFSDGQYRIGTATSGSSISGSNISKTVSAGNASGTTKSASATTIRRSNSNISAK